MANYLLKRMETEVIVPPSSSKFFAAKNFLLHNSEPSGLKINLLGNFFTKHFLEKTEEAQLKSSCLKLSQSDRSRPDRYLYDSAIIEELKERGSFEVSLYEFYYFLKIADQHNFYVFYIRDVNNFLYTVFAEWNRGGWEIRSLYTENKSPWLIDITVVTSILV